jgi:hypothetical protein
MPTAKKIGEDVETIDGILGEVVYKSGKKVMKSTTADKAHWFSQLKRYELDRGYKEGWAAHKFREKFRFWPDHYRHVSIAATVSTVAKYLKIICQTPFWAQRLKRVCTTLQFPK